MADASEVDVFTEAAWEVWEQLIEAARPRGKTPPKALRRTISAIFWRHQNGATWRAIPAESGPGTASPSLSPTDRLRGWWLAAQLFIRWAKQGVWERLLGLAQEHVGGAELSMADAQGRAVAFVLVPGLSPDSLGERIWDVGARPAIPAKRNEAPVRGPDFIDGHRNHIERLCGRLKECRAIATRSEETARSFLGVLCLAAMQDWLKRHINKRSSSDTP